MFTPYARAMREMLERGLPEGKKLRPQDLPKVMEPFFTTTPHGNGLGLPICRAILWEIGGAITLDSHPGVGTRVELTLPLAATLAATASPLS